MFRKNFNFLSFLLFFICTFARRKCLKPPKNKGKQRTTKFGVNRHESEYPNTKNNYKSPEMPLNKGISGDFLFVPFYRLVPLLFRTNVNFIIIWQNGRLYAYMLKKD